MNLVTVISTSITTGRRLIKLLRFGKNDVQEVREITPFGYDGNPPEGMTALYGATSEKGKAVIVGYINTNQSVEIGETKIYSTDADLAEQMYLHLKNDGTAEFGGDSDFMVRYSELETAFNQLKSDFNTLVSTYNSHTHPFVGLAVGVPGSTAPTASSGSSSTADITGAKIEEIKTL